MLTLQNIRFQYPGSPFCLAVKSLAVRAGEPLAVLGPSGGGKTTLLRLMTGLLQPDSGAVVCGEPQLTSLPAEQRRPWLQQADLRAAAALLLLEQASLRRQLLLVQEDLKQRYLAHRETPDADLAEVGGALEQLLAGSGFLSRPAELIDGGYGLPQEAEWQALSRESGARQAKLLGLASDLDEGLRGLVDESRRHELEAVEANLASLGAHLRKLHTDSGGLVLP